MLYLTKNVRVLVVSNLQIHTLHILTRACFKCELSFNRVFFPHITLYLIAMCQPSDIKGDFSMITGDLALTFSCHKKIRPSTIFLPLSTPGIFIVISIQLHQE